MVFDKKEYMKQYNKQYNKQYREEHEDKLKHYQKQYHKQYDKQYRKAHKEQKKQYRNQFYEKNKKKENEQKKQYQKSRRNNDPMFKLITNVRNRVNYALKSKSKHTMEYIRCTPEFLYNHLQCQLPIGVSMNDLGKNYHIDHIIPIMYNNPTQDDIIFRLGWYNLQVLSAEDNMKKSNNKPNIDEIIKLGNNLIKYNEIKFSIF
jgi:hypothetical protein